MKLSVDIALSIMQNLDELLHSHTQSAVKVSVN